MAAPTTTNTAKAKETVKKKVKKNVPVGLVYIQASFNNTIITFTDPQGGVIAWSSAGSAGFKGSRKGTPFAAQLAAENAGKKAVDCGMRNVNVLVSGPGAGRESALRVLHVLGFKIGTIKDTTPIPHNGCRPPKRRRV
jgi:small subunit ribosomal protein S11